MSEYSVKRPITVFMGILIIIVLGIFSVTKLPLTLFPDINLPYLVTITTYEGANPEQVEAEVSRKIESSVSTVGNFRDVYSMSNEHFAVSIITFANNTNMDSVIVELREMLNNINFPSGVGNTRILRISPNMMPVMVVNLFRTYKEDLSDEEILIRNTQWIQQDVVNNLMSIPGVADVNVSGAADTVLQILLDDEKLTQYGLDHEIVLNTIERQNVSGLIGVVLDNGEIRMLYLGEKINLISDLEKLPITYDGDIIYLQDVIIDNGIKYVNANTASYSKINGRQGIQISFQMQSDASITEVTSSIVRRLNEIVNSNEIDSDYRVLMNQGEYIIRSINTVLMNIIYGGLIAIIILFLFLRNIKPTLIVGLAIPISVIAAFMLMYFTNITLNMVSMGGLALGIGMLVDNAVVVIENIYRMISEGKSKKEASVLGARQVAGAITASTLTTAAVFLPLVFVEGIVSDVFMSMALTIAYSLGASLVIALTLVPTLSSQFLNDQKITKEGKVITAFKSWYEKSIVFSLKNKFLTLLTIILLFAISVTFMVIKGFVYLPASDEGSISITIEVTNQVDFIAKSHFADLLSEQILEIDDVETVSGRIGSSGFMSMFQSTGNSVSFNIILKENRKLSTIDNSIIIENLINEFDYDLVSNFSKEQIIDLSLNAQNSAVGFLGTQGINIKVSGYDLLTLEKIANDIANILDEVDGVIKIDNGINQGQDNVRIGVNREQAIKYGLTNQDVVDNVSFLYQYLGGIGQTQSIEIEIEGVKYQLEVPESSIIGGINFDIFGNYLSFLSGVMLFDSDTRILIDEFMERTNQGIYVINAFLPPPFYNEGDPIKFIVNPFLRVSDGEIVFNPMSADPTLASISVAPLYQNNENSVTNITKITGFASINTDGSNRFFNVTGRIEHDKNVTLVSQDAIRQINAYLDSEEFTQFGRGYTVEFQGENEEIMGAFEDLIIAALVAILLVYMIMAIQFQSLKYPLIILGTIPLAFTGGMIALLITNSHLSLVSLMGFIILIGIVVNNGIVIIDYINKLRDSGKPLIQAIIEAGKTRLRPIFMTALTTIFALITLAIGYGEGAELLQPMAITAIGGLIYATILTLIVVPTIYVMLNRKESKTGMNNGNN